MTLCEYRKSAVLLNCKQLASHLYAIFNQYQEIHVSLIILGHNSCCLDAFIISQYSAVPDMAL